MTGHTSESTVQMAKNDQGETEMTTSDCVFCDIIAGTAPAKVVHRWPEAIAIVPLGPVVDGHLLVIPTAHVRDALEDPEVTAAAVRRAAEIAPRPCNLITNAGREATQSVWHLHWHVVPRTVDDGLALPWYSGKRSRKILPAQGAEQRNPGPPLGDIRKPPQLPRRFA